MSVSEKYSSTTFKEVGISRQMAPLWMLYIVALAHIIKVTKLLEKYNIVYLQNGES